MKSQMRALTMVALPHLHLHLQRQRRWFQWSVAVLHRHQSVRRRLLSGRMTKKKRRKKEVRIAIPETLASCDFDVA